MRNFKLIPLAFALCALSSCVPPRPPLIHPYVCSGTAYDSEIYNCVDGRLTSRSSSSIAMSSSGISSSSSGEKGNNIANYRAVKIGTQTWMAENLDYNVAGSRCYSDDPANCAKYGRLYDWATAMALPSSCNTSTCSGQIGVKHRGICPYGWHIPSNAELDTLVTTVGDPLTAGKYLKATSGWNEDGNGTDDFGFSALPGGTGGLFLGIGNDGIWWSSSQYFGLAYEYRLSYDNAFYRKHSNSNSNLRSVRCIKD